jgi:hypothetical protein
MDVLEREREHLAEADRHIAAAKQQVEQQKRVSFWARGCKNTMRRTRSRLLRPRRERP